MESMISACIKLEARSPARRCHRAYEIAVSPDLFGAWLVEMTYGRIGTFGCVKPRSFSTAEAGSAWLTGCGALPSMATGIRLSWTNGSAPGFRGRPTHRRRHDLT